MSNPVVSLGRSRVPARRAVAAIRVSKERDGMISPENQRFAIEQYAERENITVVEWIEGIDESGSKSKSAWWSKLDYGVRQVEEHRAEMLLVWKYDRTSRNRLKWALTIDRLEQAGGYIESATEPNDRSPAGEFGRGVMVEHAIFTAKAIGATWKETLERRVRHGLTPNGARHFGYTYSKSDGRYEIDPVEAPILVDMYRSYGSGTSAWQLADRYTDKSVQPNAHGKYPAYSRWNSAAVLRVLDSGFAAGYILFRDELHPGAHEALITEEEWVRFKHAREHRRRRPRAERSAYTYSGFIYCHCGSRMGGRVDHGYHRYGCTASIQYAARSHPNASISAAIIDEAVGEWLETVSDRLNAAARSAPRRPSSVNDPVKDLSRKLLAATERLDAATLKFVDGLIPADAYERIRVQLDEERAHVERELTRASAQATVAPIAFVGDLMTRWRDIPVEQRREALRLIINRIEVGKPSDTPRIVIHSNI